MRASLLGSRRSHWKTHRASVPRYLDAVEVEADVIAGTVGVSPACAQVRATRRVGQGGTVWFFDQSQRSHVGLRPYLRYSRGRLDFAGRVSY